MDERRAPRRLGRRRPGGARRRGAFEDDWRQDGGEIVQPARPRAWHACARWTTMELVMAKAYPRGTAASAKTGKARRLNNAEGPLWYFRCLSISVAVGGATNATNKVRQGETPRLVSLPPAVWKEVSGLHLRLEEVRQRRAWVPRC